MGAVAGRRAAPDIIDRVAKILAVHEHEARGTRLLHPHPQGRESKSGDRWGSCQPRSSATDGAERPWLLPVIVRRSSFRMESEAVVTALTETKITAKVKHACTKLSDRTWRYRCRYGRRSRNASWHCPLSEGCRAGHADCRKSRRRQSGKERFDNRGKMTSSGFPSAEVARGRRSDSRAIRALIIAGEPPQHGVLLQPPAPGSFATANAASIG
jgi:hypothetical protein